MAPEKNSFKMDDNLLRQVIMSQAGDWKKGLIELVQNSIDAINMRGINGYIDIQISKNTLIFEDNGIGFGKNKEDITRTFGLFGNSIKSGNLDMIGCKGMGRGQAFSIIYDDDISGFNGTITIQTNGYILTDINLDDLSYSIDKAEKKNIGTIWTFESNKREFNLDEIRKYLEDNIRIKIPISINGQRLKFELETHKFENDSFSLHIQSGTQGRIRIFERGLFIQDYHSPGLDGTLMINIPLKLNFARNDIISNDTWMKIKEEFREFIVKYLKDKKRIGLNERDTIFWLSFSGDFIDEFLDMAWILTAQEKWISPKELEDFSNNTRIPIYIGNKSRAADKAIQSEMAFIVLPDYDFILEHMGIPFEDFDKSNNKEIVELRHSNHKILSDEEASKYRDQILLLEGFIDEERHILIGKSKTANGWTDGNSFIAINEDYMKREILKKSNSDIEILLNSIHILSHELAHDDNTLDTDIHGPSFYENQIRKYEWMISKIGDMMKKEMTKGSKISKKTESDEWTEGQDGTWTSTSGRKRRLTGRYLEWENNGKKPEHRGSFAKWHYF